ERGEDYSYGQCGLPYVVNEVIPSIDDVISRTAEEFREKYQIDAKTNTTVTGVDSDKQIITAINTETNQTFNVEYDRLLIATGSGPVKPDWDGIDLAGIHSLKTMTDTNALMADLTTDVKQVTIIGGGYIGLEMAE